ncbi:MAG: O-methyltransferase [Candidatus Gastranaerophilales bacterium]|nr:O-methyltransferase [Candidatus Gastranaerophilales bacterium]
MQDSIKQVLLKLEKTSEKYWNIPPESGKLLNLIIKSSGYKDILEIGTSNGYSAIWLAEAAKKNSGYVTGIEFSQERIDLAINNFKECGLSDYISVRQGKALDIIKALESEFDFIFIDANKAEYIKYFELLHPRLRSKGLIAADNVTSHKEDVQDFLDSITNHPEYQTSYLPFGGGLLLGLKIN